ncbi:orf52 [Alcelaphine gammaherpesvirus 2]|uniref:Orf52 n=1 Tax=Alcelaphine gammaherpesvirus 2 TaxID=138184 RepID=A0A068A9X3_9GAMA|nr:orf52 [Alcelaphine gammaherpesvirus 2]AIA62089.1 orf52 [Alcelaphine gammaherpesvirus 2]
MDPSKLTVQQLAAQLAELQMENSKLRRKLRRSVGGPLTSQQEPQPPHVLSPEERRLVLARWHSRFNNKAAQMLQCKIESLTAILKTEEDINKVLGNADFRLHFAPDNDLHAKKLRKEKRRQARGEQQ